MKRNIIIGLIIGAVMLGAFVLFDKSSTSPKSLKPDKAQLVKDEKAVAFIDKHYTLALNRLKEHGDSLETELRITKEKLSAAKLLLGQTELLTVHLAEKDTAHETIRQKITDCDSLKAQVLLFASKVDSTQELYDCAVSRLESMVAIKDSEIVVCRSSYTELKCLMDENLMREQKLTEDLQTVYKQQRRKTLQSKLMAGGFLIMTGITTSLYFPKQ
jgi:hypothetical protein